MNAMTEGRKSSRPMRLNVTVAVLAGAGILSSASVWAQDATAAAGEQAAAPINSVVVTGVRRAAQSAQTLKMNSDEVIDAIVAEEAGKFPDKNVAEILGRVSGVQIRREFGEASSVVIRGLTGLVTLLNGREVYTSNNRSLYLADIPTTMLQSVQVYKTQGAEMVEGGTAGVIDVRTNRPFDFKGFQANVQGRVENRDKSKTNDPQLSGMVSNRWTTGFGEIGALIGVSHQKGNYHDEVTFNSPPAKVLGDASPVTGPFDFGHVLYQGERVRTAANWAVQWRPNRAVEVFAEGWSTRIDHDAQRQFMVASLGWGTGTSNYTLFPGTNQVDSYQLTNGNPFTLSSTQAPRDDSEAHQGALGARWKVSDDWTVTTEFARTNSKWKQDFPIMDMRMFPKAMSGYTYRDGGAYFTYPGFDMMNPANYSQSTFFDNWSNSRGQSNDWRADAIYTPAEEGLITEVGFGVRIASRKAAFQHETNGLVPDPGNLPAVTSSQGLACPSMEMAGDYGLAQWLTPCADYLHTNIDKIRVQYGRPAGKGPADPYSLYRNKEDTQAIYGKLKYGFDVAGIPVSGTAGVRVVKTELDVNGFNSVLVNGVQTPVAVSQQSSGTDVMPNFTLKAQLTSTLIGRINAGKAIQRPNFGDFNPGTTYNGGGGGTVEPNASGGNPDLKPITGKNLDVALEWYFAPTGSLTATAFKHDFEDYIIRRDTFETFNGVRYLTNRPRNVQGGTLEGIEIGYRQFYDFLPGWLGGFGMEANYTYMKGHLMDNGVKNPFVNMSKNAYNVVALYERGPWSGRLAYNYRSAFVDTYNYRGLGFDLIVDPIKTADASLSYKFNENLGVTLDVENLTDRKYHDYHGIASNPRDIRRYDRVIGLSVRWKM